MIESSFEGTSPLPEPVPQITTTLNKPARRRPRTIDDSQHRVREYESVDAFMDVTHEPAGIVTVNHRNVPIDLLVAPSSSDTVLVFFHGAIERHFSLPVLSGMGISGGVTANRVFVSDPSLYLNEKLRLAWYAGNYAQVDLQDQLTRILEHIFFLLGARRVAFFGGSGGGFASLYYASRFENSLALPFNPQTNIRRYMDYAVGSYMNMGFRVNAPRRRRLANKPLSVVSNLCTLYHEPQPPLVAYMQNLNDKTHIREQLRPFLRQSHADNRMMLLAEPWKAGHTPPPKPLLTNVLDVASSAASWEDGLSELGFQTLDYERRQRMGFKGLAAGRGSA
ncbi:hypothetical protein [Citricoccus sp. NR2]|uniref:hypothetical protein n=1 Tax=Citricoccus sp. NR2 TaxID=3004095 RepID=UPI0022DD1BA0|nr:hypothetical protein [Citricoccus sp. NR2]WBL19763.1 hypothetical protein O1A05_03445 [Citricoccus sp. NR2]